MSARIRDVQVATVQGSLPSPVTFGEWVMKTREYAVVRVRTDDGVEGWSFGLTRDGSVAAHIRQMVAPSYAGTALGDRQRTFHLTWRRSLASNASGIGLRALSLVDLATWDAAARYDDVSINTMIGAPASAMPATAIIGYPPSTMDAAATGDQVRQLAADGWRRFKAPVAASEADSIARLEAARAAAPDAWLGCDCAWIYDDLDRAVAFASALGPLNLGWLEDIFPPGDAQTLAELRRRAPMPIAMGDEQGGAYYPQALLDAEAVDVVRVDLTCMGGISGGRRIVEQCQAAGVAVAPHMFAHVHSRVFSAWGLTDAPVEWGVPWSGVDPYADSLTQPVLDPTGRMLPLPEEPGFGELVNREWLAGQQVDDPERILDL